MPTRASSLQYHARRLRRLRSFVNTLDPDPSAIVIRSVSAERGLTLSDGTRIRTAALFINDVAFLWHPPTLAEADLRWTGWTPDDFAAIEIVEPRPDVLVVGTGPTLVPMPSNLRAYLSSLGVAVDIQDTVRRLTSVLADGRSAMPARRTI